MEPGAEARSGGECGASISATAGETLCFGVALAAEPNEDDGNETGGEGRGAADDVLEPAGCGTLRTGRPPAAPLSNCSMGKSRCAWTILSMPSSR